MTAEEIRAAMESLLKMAAEHAYEYAVGLTPDELEILKFYGAMDDPNVRRELERTPTRKKGEKT